MSMQVISAMTRNPPLDKQTLPHYNSLHYEDASNFRHDMESSFRQTFLHYTLLHYEHASNFCNDRECTFRQTNIAALHFTLHYIMTMSVISAMTGNPPSGKETLLCYTSLHYEPVSNFCYDRKSSLIQTDIAACCITLRYIMSMRVISAMTENPPL